MMKRVSSMSAEVAHGTRAICGFTRDVKTAAHRLRSAPNASGWRQKSKVRHAAIAFVLSVMITACTAPDASSSVDDPLYAVAAAACDTLLNIPMQQRPAEARQLMDGEVITDLTFEPYPELGVWTHEIFIKDARVELPYQREALRPILGPLTGAFTVYGDGDGREHMVNFDPRAVRAFIVLDFEQGMGYLISNNSMILIDFPLIDDLSYTFEARPVPHIWKGEDGDWGADSWVRAGWVDPDTFRVRYHLLENVWFSDAVAAVAPDVIAPIDAQFTIKRDGTYRLEHDNFPSYGTYHYPPCASAPARSYIDHQVQLSDLNAPTDYSYDADLSSSPATPPPPADGCTDEERANANRVGCDCKDHRPFGGFCAVGSDGCTEEERANANRVGCDCKDHVPFGGFCGTEPVGADGCTDSERANANRVGCDCKDHQPFGGFCGTEPVGADGCTDSERANANRVGCDCKNHKPFGGFCAIQPVGADGCTASERANANRVGCDCKNHKPFGGFCAAGPVGSDGCTDQERANANRVGCDCKDHRPSGGFCANEPVGSDGCTDQERTNAGRLGCDCKDHKPSGGFCGSGPVGADGCTDVERANAARVGCECWGHRPIGGFCVDPR
jgi:hypothetical protein